MTSLRIAYIGCGAVVQRSHLPALASIPELVVNVLIDTDEAQRTALGDTYDVKNLGESFSPFSEQFDLAVIATPSVSHYALAKELLECGKHVLVEKPLSVEYDQACELVELAKQKNRILSVSLVRRFLPHFRLLKSLLSAQVIGQVQHFDIEEGAVFNWPVQGAGFYRHQTSGGGVLMDNGAHLLDACLWWFGNYQSVNYKDDAQGGVEAECHLDLMLSSGASGTITMSRLRNLDNQVNVIGDKGQLVMDLASGDIDLTIGGAPVSLSGKATLEGRHPKVDTVGLFVHQYTELYRVINSVTVKDKTDLVFGRDCLESIRLIDACYKNREPLPFMVG